MKKVTLRNATNEQIAKNIERFPEKWGIEFPAYEKECTVEKDLYNNSIEVELEGTMEIYSRYSFDWQSPFTEGGATLSITLDHIQWDEEIEVE